MSVVDVTITDVERLTGIESYKYDREWITKHFTNNPVGNVVGKLFQIQLSPNTNIDGGYCNLRVHGVSENPRRLKVVFLHNIDAIEWYGNIGINEKTTGRSNLEFDKRTIDAVVMTGELTLLDHKMRYMRVVPIGCNARPGYKTLFDLQYTRGYVFIPKADFRKKAFKNFNLKNKTETCIYPVRDDEFLKILSALTAENKSLDPILVKYGIYMDSYVNLKKYTECQF